MVQGTFFREQILITRDDIFRLVSVDNIVQLTSSAAPVEKLIAALALFVTL